MLGIRNVLEGVEKCLMYRQYHKMIIGKSKILTHTHATAKVVEYI